MNETDPEKYIRLLKEDRRALQEEIRHVLKVHLKILEMLERPRPNLEWIKATLEHLDERLDEQGPFNGAEFRARARNFDGTPLYPRDYISEESRLRLRCRDRR